eukprot:TRINITY_DN26057_c0_g2_i2.p1 TRINITY_DN26057_c0_g2~~TRINITY_DN26057_c0_g2_i2.p1  ORF type:complete len:135 (-),score=17.80 TRINITY_DN26057_c0_g2_i2:290-694(-)
MIRVTHDCGFECVRHDGLCLSVKDNVFSNGQKMQLWDCQWGSGQMFDWVDQGPYSMIRVSSHPQFCVVTDGDRTSHGTALQLWDCYQAGSGKLWSMGVWGSILKAYANIGVGTWGGEYNGAPVVLYNRGNLCLS